MKEYTKKDTERSSLTKSLAAEFSQKRILILENNELNKETVDKFMENNKDMFDMQENGAMIIIVKKLE